MVEDFKYKDKIPYLMIAASLLIALIATMFVADKPIEQKTKKAASGSVLRRADILTQPQPPITERIKGEIAKKPYTKLSSEAKRVQEAKAVKSSDFINFEEHYVNLGFSREGAAKMAEMDPKVTLKISDFASERERKEIKQEIDLWKKNGYQSVSVTEMTNLHKAVNQIDDFDINTKILNFEPSILPDILINDYIYKGQHIDDYDKYAIEQLGDKYKTPFLSRVFEKGEMTLLMTEENVINGHSAVIDDFVETRLMDYPVTFSEIKNEQLDRSAYRLEVSNGTYNYRLDFFGKTDKAKAKLELLQIAEGLLYLN